MRFFRNRKPPLRVTFDLAGDFHEDIRGTRILLSNPQPSDRTDDEGTYMDGFARVQRGTVGDITAGRPLGPWSEALAQKLMERNELIWDEAGIRGRERERRRREFSKRYRAHIAAQDPTIHTWIIPISNGIPITAEWFWSLIPPNWRSWRPHRLRRRTRRSLSKTRRGVEKPLDLSLVRWRRVFRPRIAMKAAKATLPALWFLERFHAEARASAGGRPVQKDAVLNSIVRLASATYHSTHGETDRQTDSTSGEVHHCLQSQNPETPKNTIHGNVWDLDKTFPNEVAKPSRGLFTPATKTENETVSVGSTEQVAPDTGVKVKESGRLVPVELAARKSSTQHEPSCALAVVLPGGRRIEVHPDFDTDTFERLVSALERA